MTNEASGLGNRIVERLRVLGYWKNGAPEIGRFCQDKGYRPQYVYAWVKDRVPGYANLVKLARDLDTTKAWLMFGIAENGTTSTAPAGSGQVRRAAHAARRRTTAPERRGTAGPAQIIDFTRLRDVMAKLGEVEVRLDAIFRAFPDQYLWLDADGVVLAFNGGRVGSAGGALDVPVGKRLEQVFGDTVAGPLRRAFEQACVGAEVISIEYTLHEPSEDRSFEARFVPLPPSPGSGPVVLQIVRDDTARRRAEGSAAALAQVGRDIVESLDPDEVLHRICEGLLQVFRGCSALIFRFDAASATLTCTAGAGAGGKAAAAIGRTLPLGVGVCGRAVAERRAVRSRDFLNDPAIVPNDWIREFAIAAGYRAVLGVPLQAHGAVIGAIGIAAPAGRSFAPDETATACAFADQAAVGLENARLYQEARRAAERLRTLNELSRLLSSSLDPETVLQAVTRAAVALVPVDFARVGIADEARRVVELRACSDERLTNDVPIPVFPYGEGAVGWVAQRREPLLVNDVASDRRFRHPDWWARHGFTSCLALPIIHEDRLLGVLNLCRRQPFSLTPADQQLLDALVAHATVAIRNAQIFAASEEERRTAECLAEVGRLLTETLDVDVVACRIVDSVNSLLGTLASALYRLDPVTGHLRGVARGGYQDLPPIKDVVIPRGAGVAGIAVQERRAVTTTDVLADPRIILSPGIRVEMERLGYRAVLSVPLMIRGQVIGALSTGAVRGRQFTEAETRVAQAFAAQAAIALDNARRYSERDG